MSQSLNNSLPRRTQAERRAETQAAVLASACKLFGQNGYNDTALEDIAQDCGVTIRPIYHYFDNKQNLFRAVAEETEKKILLTYDSELEDTQTHPLVLRWRAFLDLCTDSSFCQIILIDSPNILGRDHWEKNAVTSVAKTTLESYFDHLSTSQAQLAARMIMAALSEAGLMIARAKSPHKARQDADDLVTSLVEKFVQ